MYRNPVPTPIRTACDSMICQYAVQRLVNIQPSTIHVLPVMTNALKRPMSYNGPAMTPTNKIRKDWVEPIHAIVSGDRLG